MIRKIIRQFYQFFFFMFLKFNNLLQLVSNLFTIAFMYDM